MYLNDFLLEHCKDDNVASIIKNLSDAAIIISNQIKNVDKKLIQKLTWEIKMQMVIYKNH